MWDHDREPEEIWADACDRLAWPDYETLLKSGVPSAALVGAGDFRIARQPIGLRDGRWYPRPQGDDAWIVPVWGAAGHLLDLVAFRLSSPRSYWPLTGDGLWLGGDEIERARHLGQPLPVLTDPLSWLRAGGAGIVILEWQFAWSDVLQGVPSIAVDDVGFARKLDAALRRPFPIPEIMVQV